MRISNRHLQRGQATSEFIGAMALFVPLVMAVIYSGKYADIKHQAIQASRYAAMQRALDPHAQEGDPIVQNETVARFFRNGDKQKMAYQETATAATADDENPNWGQLNGDAMIRQYQDITVAMSSKSLDSGYLVPLNLYKNLAFNGLKDTAGTEADVTVPVVNIPNFPGLQNINLKVRATTVIAGDPWNAGGAADVASHFTFKSVPAKFLSFLNGVPGLDFAFNALAGAPAPVLGCVKADVVPDAVAPGANYQASDPCN